MAIKKNAAPEQVLSYKSCSVKMLPAEHRAAAAATAARINPANAISLHQLARAFPDAVIKPSHLVLMTNKYWGAGGVKLTVGFLDNPPAALRKHILLHMNAWSKYGNVKFTETKGTPQVRISRTANDGYWSYLGTDILHIAANEPTMNLDSFTMNMPESEFVRVVRHETGHTLGFPHEHMRKEIVDTIDREKAIKFFMADQGWSRQEVIDQVLTPLANSALTIVDPADENSIMCYALPPQIMKSGKPVPGGIDIDPTDRKFIGIVYPLKKK